MRRDRKKDRAWARDYRKRTGRVPFPFAQPRPRTPLRGGVVAFTFGELRRLRRGRKVTPELKRAFEINRATTGQRKFSLKPKRGSRGVIWDGRAFYWSDKGYYRPGRTTSARRPLQHFIWEHHYGRKMPPMHEIFFRDRDRHNFEIDNLELLHKAELHKRTIELGEVTQISLEERREISGKRWTRHARRGTAILLASFLRKQTSTHKSNGHTAKTLGFIRQRNCAEELALQRPRQRAAYQLRKAKQSEKERRGAGVFTRRSAAEEKLAA